MYILYESFCHDCRMELLPISDNKHDHISVCDNHSQDKGYYKHRCSTYARGVYRNKNDFNDYDFGDRTEIYTTYPD